MMSKTDPRKRRAYVTFGGALLIGSLGAPFVTSDLDAEYWLTCLAVTFPLDVILAYFKRLDMSMPFGPIVEYSEENRSYRFWVAMVSLFVFLPFLTYVWMVVAFGSSTLMYGN